MHRPHFRFRQNFHPGAQDALRAFEGSESLSDVEDNFPARPIDAVPSVEELRRMMQNDPEVRQEFLNEIRQKLARGDFLTRSAAEESAGRLLDSGELFPPTP